MMRLYIGWLLAVLSIPLSAQEPAEEQIFRTTVNVVTAPVTVRDSDGRHVSGLEPRDFVLLDNDKPQDIRVDVSFVPISLVVAVQANSRVEPLLSAIRKIGPLIEQLVIGEQGEAAIMAFDHRIRLLEDFTNDGARLKKALETINAGSMSSRMVDTVFDAVTRLRRRPASHRRVLLLITETRDMGSEGRLREALLAAEIHNVIIYSVNINRAVTTLLGKPEAPRPDPIPATARRLPPGAPVTPTTTAQFSGLQGSATMFIPLLVEMFRQVKAVFFDNPVEVLTEYTGGREYSFIGQRSLERAISEIGEELHSHYLLSYTPNNLDEGGFHHIRVIVNRPELTIRTRLGYWVAAVPRPQ